MNVKAEYVWLDGASPTPQFRSKIRILRPEPGERGSMRQSLDSIPEWTFDGSSTGQAKTEDSDLRLVPVRAAWRGDHNVLVLCEAHNFGDTLQDVKQSRRDLRFLAEACKDLEPLFGFEQEYTLLDQYGSVLGFTQSRFHQPLPQGPYYCGVGTELTFGARQVVEKHLHLCLQYGIEIDGINAEVMPGQWEFQTSALSPLEACDHLMLARYLLIKVAEHHDLAVTFDPKPVPGDWNGAGCHTNFSILSMREPKSEGSAELRIRHVAHRLGDIDLAHYGDGNERRLTGKHETSRMDEFSIGTADRSASIRIPRRVHLDRKGYIEDRRPAANCDPYRVAVAILEAVT